MTLDGVTPEGLVHDRLKPLTGLLAPGELGVVAARAGVGKSACLVQIALHELLQGRCVLHVALDQSVAQVRRRYDELLDLGGTPGLDAAGDHVRLDLERRRHIHAYEEGSFGALKLAEACRFLAEHVEFRPQTVIVDGWRNGGLTGEKLEELRGSAVEVGAAVWLSALTHRHQGTEEKGGIPHSLSGVVGKLDVMIQLQPSGGRIDLCLGQDHGHPEPRPFPLWIDPATMLLRIGG